MSHQLSLLSRVTDKAEKHTAHVYAELSDGSWHTAKALKATVGVDDRTMRLIAEKSQGRILSGQQGYRLMEFATIAEADRAEAWLRSQGRAMIRRSLQIRRARNRRAA